jgi:acyl-CoA dehydrogenase
VADKTFLDWPFFADRHRALADEVERWSAANLPADHGDVDAACRDLVTRLGRDGLLAAPRPIPACRRRSTCARSA